MNVVSIHTARHRRAKAIDIREGVTDAGVTSQVDAVEELVMAHARRIAIELMRRGCATVTVAIAELYGDEFPTLEVLEG